MVITYTIKTTLSIKHTYYKIMDSLPGAGLTMVGGSIVSLDMVWSFVCLSKRLLSVAKQTL